MLILVRHAAHVDLHKKLSGRAPLVPLSDAGREQAARLGRRLATCDISLLQTSPLNRAEQTAESIWEFAPCPIETVPALTEIDFGGWTGRRFDELAGDPEWNRWNHERATARPPGGESMAEAQERVVAHLARTAARLEGETVVLVSHADVIRAAVCHVLGLDLQAYWRFDVDPASATTLAWEDWGGRLVALNERAGN